MCNAQFAEMQNVLQNIPQKAFIALKHFALVQFINFGAEANYSYTNRCGQLKATSVLRQFKQTNRSKMKIIQNYKPSYKEMFALDIIDTLYYVPMVLCVTTGLSLSNWCLVNYNPSWHLAIVIAPMVLALLYHYWIERLTVSYTMVVGPEEDCIYYTKTTLSKAIIHWIYNLLGHSCILFLILYLILILRSRLLKAIVLCIYLLYTGSFTCFFT